MLLIWVSYEVVHLVSFFSFRVWVQHTCPLFFFSLCPFSSSRTRTRTRTQKARWGCHSLEGDYHYTTIICTPLSSYFPGIMSSEPFNPHTSLEVRARSPLIFFFSFSLAFFQSAYAYAYAYAVRVRSTRTRAQYAYSQLFNFLILLTHLISLLISLLNFLIHFSYLTSLFDFLF